MNFDLHKRNKTWHYAFSVNGKRFRGSTFADNKDLALLYAQKFYNDLYLTNFEIRDRNISLADFAEIHLKSKENNMSSRWVYTNRKLLDRFVSYLQENNLKHLKDITTLHLENYKVTLLEKIKPISVKNNFRVVKAYLNHAVKLGYLNNNPATHVIPIRGITVNKVRYLPEEEIRILLEISKYHCLYDLIQVAIYSGLRREELARLEYSDVDVRKRLLYVKNKNERCPDMMPETGRLTKSRRERVIPLHSQIIPLFAKGKKGYCFTINNKPIPPRLITDKFSELIEKTDLKDVTLHVLRQDRKSVV